MIFWHVVILFLSFEVFSWGVKLNAHARWMKSLIDAGRFERTSDICFRNNWIRVYMASVMATMLSMSVFFGWGVAWITGHTGGFIYEQWVIAGIQLSHIHFFAIIARCTCLEVQDWPFVSRNISKCLSCKCKALRSE